MAYTDSKGEVRYAGRVVKLYEQNLAWDSYFYAIAWDDEAGEPVAVEYGATAYYGGGSAQADADADTMAKWRAWSAAHPDLRDMRVDFNAARRAVEDATPYRGKAVRVIKGRKVPAGTAGTVIWYGEGRYGPRVGIKDPGGEVHFTAASNVEVTAQDAQAA